jgi:hypothetical protein
VTARAELLAALACASVALGVSAARAHPIPGLFNTGVDDSGNPLPPGFLDPHFELDSPFPFFFYPRATAEYQTWVRAPTDARWIAPNPSDRDSPEGEYSYHLGPFDLECFDPSTARITGFWSTDDQGAIELNGVETGIARSGYTDLSAFTIDAGFRPGPNLLTFRVTNHPKTGADNPSGVLVTGLQGDAVFRGGLFFRYI